MSYNYGSPSPIEPLSLGNVVSAGLRLYRSHLKSYLQLGFIAYLWILVPVYGWAKSIANLALISRLAFGELVNQPESLDGGRRFVNTRLWQFFIMGLLMFAIGAGLAIVIFIPFFIFAVFFTSFLIASSGSGNTPNPAVILILLLLLIILIPIVLVALLWIQARFLLSEVPLAVEESVDGVSTIGRSWELTKGNVWRIVLILFVAYLITIPLQLPFTFLNYMIQLILAVVGQDNSAYIFLSYPISLVITLVSAALISPFWYAIKAVIYYDLRSRREGLGLKLRDYDI